MRTTSRSSVRSRVSSLSGRGPALAAIAIGLMWAVSNTDANDPRPERVLLIIVGLVLADTTVAGRLSPAFTGWYAVLVAFSERFTKLPRENYSDVLRATREAIEVFLLGHGNPYTHVFTSTDPIGSPFPYPPGEFLFYLPAYLWFDDITRVDLLISIATTACFVIAGFRVGFGRVAVPAMLYATWLYSSFHAGDGSNDTSAAFLVILAIVLLALHERWPNRLLFILSAVAFGWAVAFKQFAVFVLVPTVRYLAVNVDARWRPYLAITVGTIAAFGLPFFVQDPGAFLGQQLAALTFHTERDGVNIASALAGVGMVLPAGVFTVLELTAAAGLLLWTAIKPLRNLGQVTLVGSLAITVVILLAWWTSQAYWLYVGSVGLLGVALFEDRDDDKERGP